jgi:hypothetical protein
MSASKSATNSTPSLHDDRILPFTRVLAAVVTAILVTAWVVLYLWPEQTDRRFAWTVEPTMTAMLMGAGYGSAALFWTRVAADHAGTPWDSASSESAASVPTRTRDRWVASILPANAR